MNISQNPNDLANPDLNQIIETADRHIIEMEKRVNASTDQNSLSNNSNAQTQLKSDLEELNNSIANMSMLCIQRVEEMTSNFVNLNADISEMDGMLNIVKEATGSVSLESFTKENCHLEASKQNENLKTIENDKNKKLNVILVTDRKDESKISYPGDGMQINMRVLDNVGWQIDPHTNKGNQGNRHPLIIEMIENSGRENPWSKQSDYFHSQNSASSLGETSFKKLYS
ncbi:hypothetical protein TRFO_08995 [Tritrichomonas foetus]|uniref:Uncharacterized protein n=1 Tax=Tritrichomonas foetus TaxID=1144522 RepID=A0A1J4JII7_9EUKA|nr:hypothetical protein TRFO_08995 [Tritrichomonas foetus]|eukprot:OHS98151.1 hypothetical protein TRFO_08995 [Tritrichomonas foetus]